MCEPGDFCPPSPPKKNNFWGTEKPLKKKPLRLVPQTGKFKNVFHSTSHISVFIKKKL